MKSIQQICSVLDTIAKQWRHRSAC